MAGFAGMVHGRQSAASAKNNCRNKRNNQWVFHGETHCDPAPEPATPVQLTDHPMNAR
jgi:hypothetical protein